MGERIFEKAQAKFSLESMCRTQLGIYEGILRNEAVRKESKKEYDVVVSGYYGFHNIGDDAMLMSIVNDLGGFKPDIRMMILSRDPRTTARQYGSDSIRRTSLFRIYRVFRKSRVLLYGGGNLIQDDTSTRSLIFYLFTIWIAKKIGMKVMFYANGIGPLKRKLNRYLTGKVLNHVDVITLREEHSHEELKSLGIKQPDIRITADPALAIAGLRRIDCANILDSLGIDSNKPYIGFSVRNYPGHGSYEHESYETVISGLADYMYEKYGLVPVFIPMQYPVDIPILKRIAAQMKNSSHVVEKTLDVRETASLICCMDMLVGMRLHALIFSAAACVPVVGLSYQPKIDAFLNYLGQVSAGDVLNLDIEELKKIADDVWARKDEIRKQLSVNVEPLREKALENARIAFELISGVDK
jgi:polysaccharide pyruvyl transferase CsaB